MQRIPRPPGLNDTIERFSRGDTQSMRPSFYRTTPRLGRRIQRFAVRFAWLALLLGVLALAAFRFTGGGPAELVTVATEADQAAADVRHQMKVERITHLVSLAP